MHDDGTVSFREPGTAIWSSADATGREHIEQKKIDSCTHVSLFDLYTRPRGASQQPPSPHRVSFKSPTTDMGAFILHYIIMCSRQRYDLQRTEI